MVKELSKVTRYKSNIQESVERAEVKVPTELGPLGDSGGTLLPCLF